MKKITSPQHPMELQNRGGAWAPPEAKSIFQAKNKMSALAPFGDLVHSNRRAARAKETNRALSKNWRLFTHWCAAAHHNPLPAELNTVEAFLLYLAERHLVKTAGSLRQGMRPSAIQQALWTINTVHHLQHHAPPGNHVQIQTAMAGICRRKGMRPQQQAPLTPELLLKIPFENTLRGLRNRAMLLVGFAACLRRSELVGLQVEHLESSPQGLRLFLPHSKTDQEKQGAWVDLVYASQERQLCPVTALREWLQRARIERGAVFRKLVRGGHLTQKALAAASVDAIVKECTNRAGLDAKQFGGHSLRAGCATYLVEQNTPASLIARHGRWKSLNMVLRYHRGDIATALAGKF